MSVGVLSETLGVKKLYESLYRARSTSVHPSDIERFVEESRGLVALQMAPNADLAQILGEPMALLLRGAYWLAKRLRVLSVEECTALSAQIDDVCRSPVRGAVELG